MINNFISGKLNVKMRWQLFRTLLLVSNTASLAIYLLLHFIFFDFPFEMEYEMVILLKLFGVASGFAAGISLLLLVVDGTELLIKRSKQVVVPIYVKTLSAAALLLVIVFTACNTATSAGVKKDFNTGLTSVYSNMEPQETFLIMNNEVLNHTDIPLGESFLLVNDKIKGLQVKANKVSVGCSLEIADSRGKILLKEADLFAGHDQFDEKDASRLKCTVSTGEPMKWEEKYDVKVIFWDKYGTGKIENKVTIRCIDIP